jgi:glycogen synthase
MADTIAQTGCGVVVESVTPEAVGQAVDELVGNYGEMVATAVQVGQRDFSLEAMIDSYHQVYRVVLARAA